MQPHDVKRIREAVEAARRFAHETKLDGCDAADIDELCDALEQELRRPLPNVQTLATYMNSLARSLRAQHHAGPVVAQLHVLMGEAGIRIDA